MVTELFDSTFLFPFGQWSIIPCSTESYSNGIVQMMSVNDNDESGDKRDGDVLWEEMKDLTQRGKKKTSVKGTFQKATRGWGRRGGGGGEVITVCLWLCCSASAAACRRTNRPNRKNLTTDADYELWVLLFWGSKLTIKEGEQRLKGLFMTSFAF